VIKKRNTSTGIGVLLCSFIGNAVLNNPYLVTQLWLRGNAYKLEIHNFGIWYCNNPMYLVFTGIFFAVSVALFLRFEKKCMKRSMNRAIAIVIVLLTANIAAVIGAEWLIRKYLLS
jgi:hypothetical protein